MIVSQAWEGSFVWLLIKQPDYNASLSYLKPLPSSPIILSHAPPFPFLDIHYRSCAENSVHKLATIGWAS
jgi:hypothetical protein